MQLGVDESVEERQLRAKVFRRIDAQRAQSQRAVGRYPDYAAVLKLHLRLAFVAGGKTRPFGKRHVHLCSIARSVVQMVDSNVAFHIAEPRRPVSRSIVGPSIQGQH